MKMTKMTALLLAAALGAQARNGSGKPAYKDAGRPVEERVSDLLSRMTLEEKVMQLNQYTLGRNDNANNVADPVDKIPAEIGSLIYFDTSPELRNRLQKKAIEQSRLGIPVLFGYDVIHGFRTTYPISLAQACSWNPALVKQAAEVAAQEARMSGVEWTFSPMIDVARDGRWGRVSEGYGEDPYANAVYGVAAVEGYQGDNLADSRRVAACLKHFVGYGASEAGRDYVYTEISRQTLWDTYMPPYQAGIEAGAATVMSCFNDISGTPGTANPYILTEVLKERWAHDGFVVSDWAAIEQLRSQGVATDRKEAAEKAFNAGVEMDMMNRCYDAHLAALVREGKVSQEKLDEAVRRVLRLKFRLGLFERPYTPESEETDRFLLPASLAVAERLAEESMVLLKNENDLLPLAEGAKVAVIGDFAQTPRYQGAGSSAVNSIKVDTFLECLKESGLASVGFAPGFDRQGKLDAAKQAEAVALAQKAEVVLLCLGLDEIKESEGLDRGDMRLADNQIELLKAVQQANPNTVVVLSAGASLETPWLKHCRTLVYGALGGQAGAGAMLDVLTGKVNPSGKLAETWVNAYADTPAKDNFAGPGRMVQYREGLYVGYRYYQTAGVPVAFPFGYGLSYTSFAYSNLQAASNGVTLTVTNTGKRAGAEIVQLYVAKPGAEVFRPAQELKGFAKVQLQPGESKTVTIPLDDKAFRYWNTKTDSWEVEGGSYELRVGASSADIRLTAVVEVAGTGAPNPYAGKQLPHYTSGKVQSVPDDEWATLLGRPVQQGKVKIDRNMTLGELNHSRSPLGWLIWLVLTALLNASYKRGKPDLNVLFQYNMPLRALAKMTSGAISMGMVDGIVMELQGFWIIGLVRVIIEAVKNLVLNAQLEQRLRNS